MLYYSVYNSVCYCPILYAILQYMQMCVTVR